MPLNTSHTLAFSLHWLRARVIKFIVLRNCVTPWAMPHTMQWGITLQGIVMRGLMAACLSFGLLACETVQPQTIADLTNSSSVTNSPQTQAPDQTQAQTTEKTAIVAGEIVRCVPLVNGAAYLLKDETGALWVRTDRAPEESEQNVVVSGTLVWLGAGDRVAAGQQVDGSQDWYLQEQTREPAEATP